MKILWDGSEENGGVLMCLVMGERGHEETTTEMVKERRI